MDHVNFKYGPRLRDSEIHFHGKAKSANEQQNSPSMKACYMKNEIVTFRTIQHSAHLKFFHQVIFAKFNDVTLQFQQAALAFQTDRLLSGS
jgi:hypothetical protein